MRKSILGIEIGSSTIKLIEVTRKAATITIEKFSVLDTPKGSIQDGVIDQLESIRQVISKEIKKKQYRAKQVVAVVDSSNIIIRRTIINQMPEKAIRQLLEIKTDEYLPVEKENYQIDFRVLRELDEEGVNKNEILLVAAPNEVIVPIAKLIKDLKLQPILISIPSEALGNVFGVEKRMIYEALDDLLVLDIGGKSTTATVISRGQAILTRSINFGVDSINDAINENGGSEKVAATSKDEQHLLDIIRPQIEYSIISELERILQFYYSTFENRPIKKIYLVGGGANIKGVRTYIRDAFNIPAEKLSCFSTVVENSGIEFEPYHRFFVNILGAINGL